MKFIREPARGEVDINHAGEAREEKPLPVREVLPELLRTPTAVALMAVFFFANFVAMVFLTWMPSFL
jgi:hypothetical protein